MDYKTILSSEIQEMPKIFRLNLINSISGFKSANLIGTADRSGTTNLAIFNSVVHIGSNPPLLGMILRPTTVPRHTYENIKDSGYYTINNIVSSIIDKAHQTSANYGREESEFHKVGLTAEFKGDFAAPYVKESSIKMGMKLEEELDIKANGTKLLVGSIVELHVPEAALDKDGSLDLGKTDTVAISGLDTYWSPEKLEKFSYARPE